MKIMRKLLSVLLSACLVCSFAIGVMADVTLEGNYDIDLVTGENSIPLTDANTVWVMEYVPGEAGTFRFTLTGSDCTLYTVYGSMFYMYGPQVVEGNTMDQEIKESYANSPMLIGVAGTGTATLTIERVGDAAIDIAALPYETYETTATLSKFTLDDAIETLEYVDVTEPHSAVLGTDGYYHLDAADGPVLYMDFANAPYVSIASAAANGAMKDTVYDEDGNFVKKIEFITCINEYYGYTDNTTNRWIEGYTDLGIYPLTDDLVYILQTHTKNCGWSDITSPNYLFMTSSGTSIVVDTDTAWMFPVCYGLYSGDMNIDFVLDSSDAVYLLYHTLLPDTYPIELNGDMDGDGEVTNSDALYLLYHVLLPEQYPLA